MKIPPDYQITPSIMDLVMKIDSYKFLFKNLSIPQIVKEKIQRVSLLQSSLYSAKIEGNTLSMDELEITSDKKKQIEVFNILESVNYIEHEIKQGDQLTATTIKKIHSLVLNNLSPDAGRFRHEMNAIFNPSGIAVYVPPSPERIRSLLKQMNSYANGSQERYPLIAASIVHILFEKIHPFLDGNGRVGRLLFYTVLKIRGYGFQLFIPFEEYLNDHKPNYYHYLDTGMKDTVDYIAFMLQSFLHELEKIKLKVMQELANKEVLMLSPRQEEIYNIVRDHTVIRFDSIRRRFLRVPERTLRYDLNKLVSKKYLVKIGKTKGSFYKIVPK